MHELWLILPSMFAAGLAGSGHCFGMCGGLAALAGSGVRRHHVIYANLGRIGSYCLIGAGGSGLIQFGIASNEQFLNLSQLSTGSRLLSGVLLIMLACSIAGWRMDISAFRRVSNSFWQKLQPLSRQLLPVDSIKKACAFGALWGWLPCGLIYAVLPIAWLRGNALEAGVMLLAFGLGTLPAMLAMGMASAEIRLLLRKAGVKWFTVALIMLAGIWLLIIPLMSLLGLRGGHQH